MTSVSGAPGLRCSLRPAGRGAGSVRARLQPGAVTGYAPVGGAFLLTVPLPLFFGFGSGLWVHLHFGGVFPVVAARVTCPPGALKVVFGLLGLLTWVAELVSCVTAAFGLGGDGDMACIGESYSNTLLRGRRPQVGK